MRFMLDENLKHGIFIENFSLFYFPGCSERVSAVWWPATIYIRNKFCILGKPTQIYILQHMHTAVGSQPQSSAQTYQH